jgi:ribosomal protein L37AE/L43A
VAVNFLRTKENFVCEFCGEKVEGSGYTDHCPNCLWGKHVDINPGDRLSNCRGAMEPVGIERKKDNWRILYRCQACGHEHWNRASEKDNFKKIVEIGTQNK